MSTGPLDARTVHDPAADPMPRCSARASVTWAGESNDQPADSAATADPNFFGPPDPALTRLSCAGVYLAALAFFAGRRAPP